MFRSVFAVLVAASALPAAAQDYRAAMAQFHAASIAGWAADPVLIDAIRAQNAVTSGYSREQIAALDAAWQAETGSAEQPTISLALRNAAADFLRGQVLAAQGRITEVIVMDAAGLNVAVTSATSDLWQGDEEKYLRTYAIGPGAVHFSAIEYDDSTGQYQGQISFSVVDPANGELIGAMSVGVDAQAIL